jgi:hypothetical protein
VHYESPRPMQVAGERNDRVLALVVLERRQCGITVERGAGKLALEQRAAPISLTLSDCAPLVGSHCDLLFAFKVWLGFGSGIRFEQCVLQCYYNVWRCQTLKKAIIVREARGRSPTEEEEGNKKEARRPSTKYYNSI